METRGKLIDVACDITGLKQRLTFEVGKCTDEDIQTLYGGSLLDITANIHDDNPRTNNANRYFWKLINELAKRLGTSDTYQHDKFLSENRVYVKENGAMVYEITMDEPNEFGMLKSRGKTGNIYFIDSGMVVSMTYQRGSRKGEPMLDKQTGEPIVARVMWRIKGTHEMTKKEMSRIIGEVVLEANEQGISTLPPEEEKRLLERWKPKA